MAENGRSPPRTAGTAKPVEKPSTTMQITVTKETETEEFRVALIPESVKKLVSMKASVAVESGAGADAGASDADYEAAGARVSKDRNALLASADVLACINRPPDEDVKKLKKGAVVIGFLRPLDEPKRLVPMIEHGVSAFAVELIPRSTRAQAMAA